MESLGDPLARAIGVVTTALQRLVGDPLEFLTTMDPATVVVLGLVSFFVMVVVGYYTLLTA